MDALQLREPLKQLATTIRLADVVNPDELETGLAQLEAELELVAREARRAIVRGTPFAVATSSFDDYPYLSKIHAAIDDVLTLELEPALFGWLRQLVAMPEPPDLEIMRTALVELAADPTSPNGSALARFMLFEGIRLNLVVRAKWFPDEVFGSGLELKDLSGLAEGRLNVWLAQAPAAPPETRPYVLLVAAALHSLEHRADEMKRVLLMVKHDSQEAMRIRAEIEAGLSQIDSRHAVLIRNAIAPALGEQHVEVERLQKRHLVALGGVSRGALYQRLRRAKNNGARALRRKRPALLDILREAYAPTEKLSGGES